MGPQKFLTLQTSNEVSPPLLAVYKHEYLAMKIFNQNLNIIDIFTCVEYKKLYTFVHKKKL